MNRSDHYPAAYFRSSLFILALTYLVFYFIPFDIQDPIWIIGLSIPAVLVGQLLTFIPSYKKIFISQSEMKEECYQQALEQAQNLGIMNGPRAIYLYLSKFERRIELFIPDQMKGVEIQQEVKPHFKELVKGLKKATKTNDFHLALENFYNQIFTKSFEKTENSVITEKTLPTNPIHSSGPAKALYNVEEPSLLKESEAPKE